MSNAKLQPVLDRIDADFDNSLERLFTLLRIKSISADPAFAKDCRAAADHLAKDIATLGFKTEVRPTAGHPAVVGKLNGSMIFIERVYLIDPTLSLVEEFTRIVGERAANDDNRLAMMAFCDGASL